MKTFNRANFIYFALITLSLNFACSPPGSREVDGSITTPKGPPVQGTVSGGGGNGCEGMAFEAYARKLSTLEEYRLYLRPLLRRISEEGGDPLVTYLLWAAEEKAWFFIPCELQKLSNEQIGVAFESDQLARHGEHGIYIHSIEETAEQKLRREKSGQPPPKTYHQKQLKEKAALLLHEIVMGARLLMKKPAKEQCTTLAKKDARLCADPEVMAIAQSQDVDVSQQNVMDAADHDRVRAMTTFLAEKESDLSAANVAAVRERLGFFFPWSRAASSVDYDALLAALSRSRQLADRYQVIGSASPFVNGGRTYIKPPPKHPYFDDLAMTCSIGHQMWKGSSNSHLSIDFATTIAVARSQESGVVESIRTKLGATYLSETCSTRANRIYHRMPYDEVKKEYLEVPCESEPRFHSSYETRFSVNLEREVISARGILRDGVIYDEVAITSFMRHAGQFTPLVMRGRKIPAAVFKILLTREPAPRVHLFRIEPKQFLEHSTRDGTPLELLDIPDFPAVECGRGV